MNFARARRANIDLTATVTVIRWLPAAHTILSTMSAAAAAGAMAAAASTGARVRVRGRDTFDPDPSFLPATGGARACRHCGKSIKAPHTPSLLRSHMAVCKHLPREVAQEMDEWAVMQAHARVGQYGANPVFQHFKVIGFARAQCTTCGAEVKGKSGRLKHHLARSHPSISAACGGGLGFDATTHFQSAPGGYVCRHCHTFTKATPNLTYTRHKHLATCLAVPLDVKRNLDEWAVTWAKAACGAFSQPVYHGFEILGWQRARCTGCSTEVKGDVAALQSHADGCDAGAALPAHPALSPDAFFEPAAEHGDDAQRCRHCTKVIQAPGAQLSYFRNHMAVCPALPADVRRWLDEWAVARAKCGARPYGSNPLYKQFQVLGYMVARCNACRQVCRGHSAALKAHKLRCSMPRSIPGASELDPELHFRPAAERTCACLHCGQEVAGTLNARKRLRDHMATCGSLPPDATRALDAWVRAEVRCGDRRKAAGAAPMRRRKRATPARGADGGTTRKYRRTGPPPGFVTAGPTSAQCLACGIVFYYTRAAFRTHLLTNPQCVPAPRPPTVNLARAAAPPGAPGDAGASSSLGAAGVTAVAGSVPAAPHTAGAAAPVATVDQSAMAGTPVVVYPRSRKIRWRSTADAPAPAPAAARSDTDTAVATHAGAPAAAVPVAATHTPQLEAAGGGSTGTVTGSAGLVNKLQGHAAGGTAAPHTSSALAGPSNCSAAGTDATGSQAEAAALRRQYAAPGAHQPPVQILF